MTIADNKKAFFDYFIEERYEAGMALEGWEVKSIRAGRAQISDAYVVIDGGELWLLGSHISPLLTASTHIHPDPTLGLLVGTAAATLLGVVCSFSIMRGRMSSFCLMRYAWSAVPCGKARMSFESPFFATWNTLPAFQSVTV